MRNDSKGFALKLSCLIESGALNARAYIAWADAVIEQEDVPPFWIINLSLSRDRYEAVAGLSSFAFSEPFVEHAITLSNFSIACLYLQYERKELAWVDFLQKAGGESDGGFDCFWGCEEFYHRLRLFVCSEFEKELENLQRAEFLSAFQEEIDEAKRCRTIVQRGSGTGIVLF